MKNRNKLSATEINNRSSSSDEFLRKEWRPLFHYDWKLGLFLILLFGIPRFMIVLHSYVTRNLSVVMWVFVVMWFLPFILLSAKGRTFVGFKRPVRYVRLGYSFLAGGFGCAILFGLFLFLFGGTIENPFAYIGESNPGTSLPATERQLYFWIAVIPSMIFSPLGEEFLYRGVIHGSFVNRFGETRASVFDSLAFAVTHLAHFGIVYVVGNWRFLPLPALLWVGGMFAISQVFFRCKVFSGSIWGAVVAHAGFNFAMMYLIFYHLP